MAETKKKTSSTKPVEKKSATKKVEKKETTSTNSSSTKRTWSSTKILDFIAYFEILREHFKA